MIAMGEYTLLSGDTSLLQSTWSQTVLGVSTSLAKVDAVDSLLNVTDISDWGRTGQGNKNIAANTLLYRVLVLLSDLADELALSGTTHNGSSWRVIAASMKASINKNLWDEAAGQYRDNATTTLHPQGGNVLAVKFNVTASSAQAARVSSGVSKNWNKYGSVAPEGLGTISPFITSSEIDAHFIAHPANASLAMGIMRRQWGYTLNKFSNSTLMEGFYETGELEYPFYGIRLGAYISHAHAWSTGPVASLTLQLGGLVSVRDAGKIWSFQPHVAGSGVNSLQTGYTLASGFFSVEWTASATGDAFFQAKATVPSATSGSIAVSTFGNAATAIHISINGKTVWKKASVCSDFGVASVSDGYVTFPSVATNRVDTTFVVVAKKA